jgi:hypothetical protein
VKNSNRIEVGGQGKTYTKRECSCYEASPGRFVIQLTVFHARAAAEVDFYDCTPLPAPAWGQAAFRLTKACGLSERPTYEVLLDGDRSQCDCKHGTYRPNAGPCRHVLACQALVARGLLPTPARATVRATAQPSGRRVRVPATLDAAAQPAADEDLYCTCEECGRPAAQCQCEIVLATSPAPAAEGGAA